MKAGYKLILKFFDQCDHAFPKEQVRNVFTISLKGSHEWSKIKTFTS